MELINNFINDLTEIGINPTLQNDIIKLEFAWEKERQKLFVKLLNKYVGFWKSIAIKTNYEKKQDAPKWETLRYQIPMKLITGADITEEQLLTIVHNISKKILVPK